MLVKDVAVHVRKDSPKERNAKFSIYFQPAKLKFGISYRKENNSVRVLLLQKTTSGWKSVSIKGAGLKNDESVDS